MESVVWRQSKSQRSVGTVDTSDLCGTKRAARCHTCWRSEIVRHRSVAEARKHVDDWCNRPVVQDRFTSITDTGEVGVVNNAGDEFMPPVERRQTVFTCKIERIERRREARREGRRTL